MDNRDVLLKSAAMLRAQDEFIKTASQKLAAFEKKAEAEKVTNEMVAAGLVTGIDQYLVKVAQLSGEDLEVVKKAMKHGMLDKVASQGFSGIDNRMDDSGSKNHGEITEFLLLEI